MPLIVKRLKHRIRSRHDLLDIWRYTAVRWGVQQAELYLIELDDCIHQLAAGEAKGTRYNSRYLRFRIGSHVIFYRETEREVTIVRVLHGRMDVDRHLPR